MHVKRQVPSCLWQEFITSVLQSYMYVMSYRLLLTLCTLDVDECSINPDVCHYGSCINLAGSYRCECDMGFSPTLDGKDCRGQSMESTSLILSEIKEI